MEVSHIVKHAPWLVGTWIAALVVVVIMLIIYAIQTFSISKGGKNPAASSNVDKMGNVIGGMGIALCIIGGIWVLLMISLVRNTRNISTDPSSIYISRNNLLLNWQNTDASHTPGINANSPQDSGICFAEFQNPNDPKAYALYDAFMDKYYKNEKVPQYYDLVGATGTVREDDDIETQRKLSLGYYRYLYCTQAYFKEILQGGQELDNMAFLSATAKANLKSKKSSCGLANIPDTNPCSVGSPTDSGGCTPNPCFEALNQTIAAQCLLYDDHVYKYLNSDGPKGVLAAMEITGYQIKPPSKAVSF